MKYEIPQNILKYNEILEHVILYISIKSPFTTHAENYVSENDTFLMTLCDFYKTRQD